MGVYVFGLFVLAMGVAFSINSQLGVSPVNTLPFVISQILGTQVGMWTTALMALFVAAQIAILRKKFKWINLTQVIFAFIFGFFVDFTRWILGDFLIPTYFGQLAMLAISIVLIAAGIVLFMSARLVNLPPEGFCAVIADKYLGGKFHIAKIIMDSALVAAGIALSLLFLGGLIGVREGTVISAVLIGKIIPAIKKALTPILSKLQPPEPNQQT